MNLSDLKNKKISILGYGIENQALVNFLVKKKIECKITICDSRTSVRLPIPGITWKLGKNYDKNLNSYDIVFRVAGYPLFTKKIINAKKAGVIISDATKLFFDLCPSKNIIGVTGTKGKGTTSSLIYKIIKASKKRVHFGGNIGVAMFSFLDKIKKNDYVVLELSSFQLEELHISPRVAVITNFSKEHLAPADPNNPNFHKTLATYKEAKANIIANQNKNDYAVINESLRTSFAKLTLSKKKLFTKSKLENKLIGNYNKENIAAAVRVAKILKIKNSTIEKTVKNFKGLPHRIEFVAKKKEVTYYDNSFATIPKSTMMDIDIFNSLILIAGGADKGANFKPLAKKIKSGVKYLILLDGKGTKKIIKELNNINFPKNKRKTAKSMKEAIKISKLYSEKGDTVLLSTACASFGMFKNYKERGNLFKGEVLKN